jgi:hypothetical protein
VWWDVRWEIVGRKCGGMFGGKLLVESVAGCLEGKYRKCGGDVWRESVGRKYGGMV